jgi:membrane fusion protein, multidrug efflux system
VMVFLSGCSHPRKPDSAEAASKPALAVRVIPVAEQELESTLEAPGTVRAAVSSTLSSKVLGYVREIRVRPGDRVSPNQLIAVIDARDLDAMLLQAKAAEREARSGIPEAENAVAAAKAQQALAEATFRRMEGLYKTRSISPQEFEEVQAKLRTAEAATQMAIARRTQLDAKIEQAEQAVASASVMRSHAEVRAPFAGLVTEKKTEAGQMATPGSPLVTVEQSGAYRLEASVEESLLSKVRVGEVVTVVLDAIGEPVPARITEIVPAIDASSRSFLVKAALPPNQGLRSGLFGRLRINRGTRTAITIPVGAAMRRGDMETVMVADSGVARARMVTTGTRQDGRAEVLSGLQPGDQVIFPIPQGLTDGAKVEVR